jgi:hypothetical protein
VKFGEGTPSDVNVQDPSESLTVTFDVQLARWRAPRSLWAVATVRRLRDPADELAAEADPVDTPARAHVASRVHIPKTRDERFLT